MIRDFKVTGGPAAALDMTSGHLMAKAGGFVTPFTGASGERFLGGVLDGDVLGAALTAGTLRAKVVAGIVQIEVPVGVEPEEGDSAYVVNSHTATNAVPGANVAALWLGKFGAKVDNKHLVPETADQQFYELDTRPAYCANTPAVP